MVLCHLNGIFIPEEIRSVEHENMQGMAFDPLTTIEQPSKFADLRVNLYVKGGFALLIGIYFYSRRELARVIV